MMKAFFRTGAYRPPVICMGGEIAKILLLFFCVLFTSLNANAADNNSGIKINGKEVKWGKKGTGWDASVIRGEIRFTLKRMPKKTGERVYRITGTAKSTLEIIVERDVKDCEFILEDLTITAGYIRFYDCEFNRTGGVVDRSRSSSVNTNTIIISGTTSITGSTRSPITIDGQNQVVIDAYGGAVGDKYAKLILKGTQRPAISSGWNDGRRPNLVIRGGTIEAYGGEGQVGIGSNTDDYRNMLTLNTTIEGGYVKAVGYNAPGIGGRWPGQVYLKGGTLEANKDGNNADIGITQAYNPNGNDYTSSNYTIDISGGSMKTTSFSPRVSAYDGNEKNKTYRVEVPIPKKAIDELEAKQKSTPFCNNYIKIKGLKVNGADYGDEGLYYDNDGKIYIWLPNGKYEFSTELWEGQYFSNTQQGTFEYVATVNNGHTTAKQVGAFSPTIDDISIASGQSYEINKTINPKNVPADYKGTVTYTSSDNGIVTCDNVNIQGVAAGTATITATYSASDNYKVSTAKFNVEVKTGVVSIDNTQIIENEEMSGNGWKYTSEIRPFIFCYGNCLQINNTNQHTVKGLYDNQLPVQLENGSNVVFENLTLNNTYVITKGDANISLKGKNYLTPLYYSISPITVEQGNTITIDQAQGSTGATLIVRGGTNGMLGDESVGTDGGAGLGCGRDTTGGNIKIKGGIIRATGVDGGSGIGGGYNGTIGTIAISGGTVFASNDGNGYDIGSGKDAAASSIQITGGSVKATSFNGDPTNDKSQRVYRVTVGNLTPNAAVNVTEMSTSYGTKDIYADEEGKIYLWLPNGAYSFKVNGTAYDAAVNNTDGVLMLHHAGTAEDPYLISNVDEWNCFSAIVNSGKTTAWGKLTANVGPVQTTVGTSDKRYSGTFDGNGNTLLVDYNNIDKAAPFSYVKDGTVKNLTTQGQITNHGQYSGGIVGLTDQGVATVTNCKSEIIFQNTNATDASTGGLVGGGVAKISDCIFSGSIKNKGKNYAGIMGWANAGTTLTNCLQIGTFEVNSNDNSTLVRGQNSSVTITNCYYMNAFGTVQGTQVTDEQLASGEVAYRLQGDAANQVWGQNLGMDAAPVLTTKSEYRIRKAAFSMFDKEVAATYAMASGNFSEPDLDELPATATYNPANYEDMDVNNDIAVEIQLFNKDNDGYYLINNVDDWNALVTYYNGVGNFRLKADLDSVSTMLGTDAVRFKGTFDGTGHTLNVNLVGTSQYTAPFTRVENATIKNLKVTGTVNQAGTGTAVYHASGLVGSAKGVTLDRCVSSVALSFNTNGDVHTGGLVGHAHESTVTVRDCAFTGSFSEKAGGANASVGGIVGWGETSCKVDIKNSYVDLASLTNIVGQNNLVRANNGWNTNGSKFENCYYTVPDGVRDWDAEPATKVTKEQMKSGMVAYKLQAAHNDGAVWGQKIGTDADPVLKSNDKVYEVAFTINDKAVRRYANSGGTVTSLPTYADFRSVLGNDFDNGKYTDNALIIPDFDINTPVTADRTVVCQTTAKEVFDVASVSDWNKLATAVSEGQTRINARLTANVSDVKTPIGSEATPYRGTFDGQRFTLNVNLSASKDELAPFSRTDGANIKNLTVTGSITSDKKFAGSIVGRAMGNTVINDVASSATLTFNSTDDATYGGLVGISTKDGTTTLNNTAFTGTLNAPNGCNVGGLVGWAEGNVNVSNSLMAANINVKTASSSNEGEGNCALVRRNSMVTVSNCYARNFTNCQTMQGVEIKDEQLRNGSVAHDLQIKQTEMHWGQTLPSETMPKLTTDTNNQVFRVDFQYAPTAGTDIFATQFLNRGKKVTPIPFSTIKPKISYYDAGKYYQITYGDFNIDTQVDKDYTVNTNYTSVDGLEITNANDWQKFADAVAEGQNHVSATLMNDVKDVTTMVGTEQNPYTGKFDGNYHTLTVNLTSDKQFCAPFQRVQHAEINNLKTAGTVTASDYHASGLVGRADWVHIHNCEVGVNVRFANGYKGDDVHSGGFVGHGADNEVYIDKCAFNGSFSAASGQSFNGVAGFLGWGGSNVTIKNSYVHSTPKGTGCQSYYPFIYKSGGVQKVSLEDCFAADYNEGGINYDEYNQPCTKVDRQQVESGYATYMMQQRIPEIFAQVEPVWGQKMDGTDKMPHVVGDDPNMKVIRNIFSANDSIYDNYFILDENKDNVYNFKENYNTRFNNYNLKLKRKFAPGWNTLVLPIQVDYEELVEKLGAGTKVARFSNDEENVIRLDTIATDDSYQELYYNEPFLVYTQTQDSVFTFNCRMISTTEYPAKNGTNGIDFIGSYADSYTVQPDEYFISGTYLWKSLGNTVIKGTRAFFRVANQSAGSNIYLVWGDDDDPTAINSATADANSSSTLSGPVYNLNGQKVGDNINDMPKGIYIVNGKKIKK